MAGRCCDCRQMINLIRRICQQEQTFGVSAKLTVGANNQVPNQNGLLFDTIAINNTSGRVAIVPSSDGSTEFHLNKRGTYLINWNVAIDGTTENASVTFSLLVDGVTRANTSMPIVTGELSGTEIVVVTTSPVIIKVINNGGDIAQLANVPVQANLTILG